MPRTFDGPLPERPARNDLSDQVGGFVDLFGGPRVHEGNRPDGGVRLDDWFGGDRPEREPRWEARDRDQSGPRIEFDFDPGGFVPRDGVHDLLKTVEFHNDWFMA